MVTGIGLFYLDCQENARFVRLPIILTESRKSRKIHSLQFHRLQGVDFRSQQHIYRMTFESWLHSRMKSMPEADKVLFLVQSAGRNGIAEPQLRSAVDLPRKLMDELLKSLVSSRHVAVVVRDGKRVFSAIPLFASINPCP